MREVSPHRRHPRVISLALSVLATLTPQLVLAQTAQSPRPHRWTLEIFGGSSSPTIATDGAPLTEFPAGPTFTTEAGQPSRQHASWYFGDGSRLLNDALGVFAAATGDTFPRIVPLDAVLTRNSLSRARGASYGVRLGRSLNSRLTLEVGVERSATPLAFTPGFKSGLDASRDSFTAAFEGLLATAPVTAPTVTSNHLVSGEGGRQTHVTAGLTYTLLHSGRVRAYATAGGGMTRATGATPQVRIDGSYGFRYFATFPMLERDRVFIIVEQPSTVLNGMFGGGVTYDLSPRTGIRVDMRATLSANKTSLRINGAPDPASQSLTAVMTSNTTPGLQFSSRLGSLSSLSGENVSTTTFRGSGMNRHVSITIGLFRRF